MVGVHQFAEGLDIAAIEHALALVDDVADRLDGVRREVEAIAELADACDELSGVARPTVVADDEREFRRRNRLAAVALDADDAAHRRGERVRPRCLPVLHGVFDLVRAIGDLLAIEFDAEFSRRGVDRCGDHGRGGADPRAEWNLALDRHLEPCVRCVRRVASLCDRFVDVARRRLQQVLWNVDVRVSRRVLAVLDGEAVQCEVLGIHAEAAVGSLLDRHPRPTLDRGQQRGFAVDDCVLSEEEHLPGSARGCHARCL